MIQVKELNHTKRKAKVERREQGYEYQMNKEQFDFLISNDGGKLKDVAGVIKYLNELGGFRRSIVNLTIV